MRTRANGLKPTSRPETLNSDTETETEAFVNPSQDDIQTKTLDSKTEAKTEMSTGLETKPEALDDICIAKSFQSYFAFVIYAQQYIHVHHVQT